MEGGRTNKEASVASASLEIRGVRFTCTASTRWPRVYTHTHTHTHTHRFIYRFIMVYIIYIYYKIFDVLYQLLYNYILHAHIYKMVHIFIL